MKRPSLAKRKQSIRSNGFVSANLVSRPRADKFVTAYDSWETPEAVFVSVPIQRAKERSIGVRIVGSELVITVGEVSSLANARSGRASAPGATQFTRRLILPVYFDVSRMRVLIGQHGLRAVFPKAALRSLFVA